MLSGGYELVETLGPTGGSTLCRARRSSDGELVLLKLLDGEHVPDRVAAFRQEYELLRSLDVQGIARPLALLDGGTPSIVLENHAGVGLEAALSAPFSVQRGLRIAAQLAHALAGLKDAKVVHRDLRPANLVFDDEQDHVCLVDLSSAGETDSGPRDLAYIAPEQTGRTGRAVDHRSDLYALGVVLYRVFSGSLPFHATDPLEWVHCHLARTPTPLREAAPAVPAVVSDIVGKLLAKSPDDRYQSAHGLAVDLERCLEAWGARGRVEPFTLGTRDVASRFHVPEKLYGRARELDALLEVHRRVVEHGTTELLLISGSSGVGKSALVQALERPIAQSGGALLCGKFEQYERGIPYLTFASAFRLLFQRVLASSEDVVEESRRRLREALGGNAQVIAGIVPELELILGEQPPLPDVGAVEAQNRLHATFHRFLDAVAKPRHPVTLFLDDLQWADPASLSLLEALLTHPDRHDLLVIGAYRTSDLPSSHPLAGMLEKVRRCSIRITNLELAPLATEDLTDLVADVFRCTHDSAAPLARLVQAKTGGEPFFALQFLKTLDEDGLITTHANPELECEFEIDRIAARDYTDNVVELMLDKLRRQPEAPRALLTLAAFIGSKADVSTLALAAETSVGAVHERLRYAVADGLLLRTESSYRFLHDRIRQAAYSLTPPEQRANLHLRLGRVLLAHASPEDRAEGPFEIASHFVLGASGIVADEERTGVARLLSTCGRRAKATAAFESAADLFSTATTILTDESWNDRYELTYQLHLERAECVSLVGRFEEAESLLAALLSRARTTPDKVAVYAARVRLHTSRAELALAIESGVAALRLVGLEVSAHPSDAQVEHAYDTTMALLEGRTVESLLDLPPTTDPETRATLDLASSMLDVASFTDSNLLALLTFSMSGLSIRKGVAESSVGGYAALAMVLLDRGRHTDAFAFGELARDLVERVGVAVSAAKVATYVGGTLNPWIKPYRSVLSYMRSAAQIGADNGDFLWASYAMAEHAWILFIAGEPLPHVARQLDEHLARVRAMKVTDVPHNFFSLSRCVMNLRGMTAASSTYDGEGFDEAAYDAELDAQNRPVIVSTHHLWKMQARFVFGHYEAALAASAKAESAIWGMYRLCTVAEFRYFDALTRAALCSETPSEGREAQVAKLVEHEKKLRSWAEGCAENFACKHALVAAEIARLEGRDADAERGYEHAVRFARASGLVQNEALANEVAARFYRARGVNSVAVAYLREAHACYARWGADGKVAQLERMHPHELARRVRATVPGPGDPGATPALLSEQLDLLTVLKVSQAISREIVLQDLLETLMRVVLETAGARTASLLFVRGSELVRAAVAHVDRQGVTVRCHEVEATTALDVPTTVLNYVRRSGEQLLLANASAPHPFSSDPYFAERLAKSVLCFPILRQAELVGLLYMENDLVEGAFTPDRLAVLELLAGQAAISLENALLYTELRRENADRRQAEKALVESRWLLQAVLDNAAASIYVKDLDGRFLLVNRQLATTVRRTPSEMLGKTDYDLFPPEIADVVRAVDAQALATGAPLEAEETVPLEDGDLHTYFSIKAPLTDPTGRVVGLCGISTDITARKRAEAALRRSEEQLRQAQKMDAIGNLAGGIAHDFNNLLSIILSYSAMLAQTIAPGDPRHADVLEIEAAGTRAAELTRQLLAFARRQVLQPKIVNLNEILAGIERMLRRLIGEDVELTVRADPRLGMAKVDPGQIEQIIMNLAVNSRDAMPSGGKLTLETANVELDASYATEHGSVNVGPHVMLAVSDTGCGMDEATRARMFEPFFTTKETGKGTGLGLATVFGIVKQSGGYIWVYSELGKGTSFKIYFPRIDTGVANARGTADAAPARTGHETILVVEDDARVRALVCTVLRRFGYAVLEAATGEDALSASREHQGSIDLLLTDVVMPKMSGGQLVEGVRVLRPDTKVLFMSGYTDKSVVTHGVLGEDVPFLQKPITPESLTRKVREVLDSSERG